MFHLRVINQAEKAVGSGTSKSRRAFARSRLPNVRFYSNFSLAACSFKGTPLSANDSALYKYVCEMFGEGGLSVDLVGRGSCVLASKGLAPTRRFPSFPHSARRRQGEVNLHRGSRLPFISNGTLKFAYRSQFQIYIFHLRSSGAALHN